MGQRTEQLFLWLLHGNPDTVTLTPRNLRFREMVERVAQNYTVEIRHVDRWAQASRFLANHAPYDLLILLGHGNAEGICFSPGGGVNLRSYINPQSFRHLSPDGRIICCACEAGGSNDCEDWTIAHHIAEASHVRVSAPRQSITATDGNRFFNGEDEVASHLSLSGRYNRENFRIAEQIRTLLGEGDMQALGEAVLNYGDMDLSLDEQGYRLLHLAVLYGDDELLEWLLDHRLELGGSLSVQNYDGDSPLHLAVFTRNVLAVNLLLRQPDIDLMLTNSIGETVFSLLERIMDLYLTRSSNRVREEYLQIAQFLVDRAQAEYRGPGTTPDAEFDSIDGTESDMELVSSEDEKSESDIDSGEHDAKEPLDNAKTQPQAESNPFCLLRGSLPF